MGLFDFLRKKNNVTMEKETSAKQIISSIPESEKKYYQDDSYYSEKAFVGTPFERKVVTFEERKKTAIPSSRGLYPAQILLLSYCEKGTYPGPKNGYPGFWWFEYGIRDVGQMLKQLEEMGYIVLAAPKDSVSRLTIPQLKEVLEKQGLTTTGKKAELVDRVSENISEEILLNAGVQRKYNLTDLGKAELEENAYVPYMHSARNKTTEDNQFGETFNVWSINALLGRGDKKNWKALVDAQEEKIIKKTQESNKELMSNLKKIDPEGYKILRTQDQQIAACQKAQAKYDQDKDLDYYIGFWEHLWNNGGLKFEGSGWHFKLPDLYIKAKRYDDAIAFCENIRKMKPTYRNRADAYIKKIEVLKLKQSSK